MIIDWDLVCGEGEGEGRVDEEVGLDRVGVSRIFGMRGGGRMSIEAAVEVDVDVDAEAEDVGPE